MGTEAHILDDETTCLIDTVDMDVTFVGKGGDCVTITFDSFYKAQTLMVSALQKAVNMRE